MPKGNRMLKTIDWISQISLVVSCLMILLLMVACSHVPMMSMAKLSRLDPMKMNPSDLRVAVRSADWLRVAPGKAVLRLGAQNDKTKERIHETFQLVEVPYLSLPAELAHEVKGHDHVAIFRLKPDDLARLYAVKNGIRAMKAEDEDAVEGFLSVDVKGCQKPPIGSTNRGDGKVTVYLKTAPNEAFFPLVRNVDLESYGGKAALTQLPACANE